MYSTLKTELRQSKICSERLQYLTQSRYQMGTSNVKYPVGQVPLRRAQVWHLLSEFFER